MCYALSGEFDQAEPLYKRVIAILEHNNFQEKREMAIALENYSLVLKKTGHDAEAKAASERARRDSYQAVRYNTLKQEKTNGQEADHCRRSPHPRTL